MNRRTFVSKCIVGAGVGAAGCLSRTRADVPDRRITGVEAGSPVPDVAVGGTVVQPEISADEQGAVQLRFAWTGDEPAVFGFGNDAPLSDPAVRSAPDGLVLTGNPDPGMRRDRETWILERLPMASLEYRTHEFGPAAAIAGTYHLWGDPEHLDHVAAGEYVVRNSVCPHTDGAPTPEDPCESFEIAYTISVEESG